MSEAYWITSDRALVNPDECKKIIAMWSRQGDLYAAHMACLGYIRSLGQWININGHWYRREGIMRHE